jgi:hypothetical protein
MIAIVGLIFIPLFVFIFITYIVTLVGDAFWKTAQLVWEAARDNS